MPKEPRPLEIDSRYVSPNVGQPAYTGNIVHHANPGLVREVNTDLYKDFIDFTKYSPVNNNLDDIADMYQTTANKLGRAGLQAGNIALATFVDTFMGTAAGLANVATGGEDGKADFNDFVNNSVSVDLQEWQKKKDEENKLFMSADEATKAWYERLGSANFWGDSIIKNAGFALGAYLSGSVMSKVIGGALGIKALQQESKLLNAAAELQKAGKGDELLKIIQEGKLKGLADDAIAAEIKEAGKKLSRRVATTEFASSLLGSIGEARMEAISNSEDFKNTELQKLRNLYGSDENIPEQYLKDLDEKVNAYQNTVFGINMPLLTLSNFIQFKNSFANGVKPNSKILLKNIEVDGEKILYKASKFDKPLAFVENPLTEMSQEQLQYAISEGAKDAYSRENDSKARSWMEAFLSSGFKGLEKAYGTAEGWENGVAGAIFGGLGMPSIRSLKNSQGKFQLPITMAGGSYSDVKEFNENEKLTKSLIEKANSYGFDSDAGRLFRSLVANKSLEDSKQEALQKDNIVLHKTLEKQQLANMVSTFSDLGMLDTYLENITQETNLTADQIRKKYSQEVTNKDGKKEVVDIFQDLTDEDLVNRFKEKAENIKQDTKEILSLKSDIEDRFPNATRQHKDSLLSLAFSSKNINKRISSLSDEIKGILTAIDLENRDGTLQFLNDKFDNYNLNDEKSAKSFLQDINKVAKKHPELSGLLNKALDLVTLTKTQKAYAEQYVEMFNPEYSIAREKEFEPNAEEAVLKNKTTPKALEFYKNNTLKDDEGFTSSDIQLESEDGTKGLWTLKDNDPKNIYGSDGKPIASTEWFVNNLKEDEKGKYVVINNKRVSVNILHASDKRVIAKNEKELRKTEARINTLTFLIKELNNKVKYAKKTIQDKIVANQEELAKIVEELEGVTDGRTRRSNKYKELLAKKAELEENIIALEIELDELRQNMPNLVARHNEYKQEKENLIKQTEEVNKNKTVPYTSSEKSKVEQRVKELEDQIRINSDIEAIVQDTILEKEIALENAYKVLEAVDFFISKQLETIYDKYPDIVNEIMSRFNISTNSELLDFARNSKERINKVVNVRKYNKLTDVIAEVERYNTVVSEILTTIEDSEVDKYKQELADLKQTLEDLYKTYNDIVKERAETDKILEAKLELARRELKIYNRILTNLEGQEGNKTVLKEDSENVETSLDVTTAPKNGKKVDIYRNGMFITAGNDGWTEDEVNPDPIQDTYYRWLENVGYKKLGLKLMTVTINDPVYGIGKPQSIYTEPEIKGVTHTEDDIRFIVINSDGIPEIYADNFVTGRLRTPNPKNTKGEDRYYSSDETEKSLDEQIANAAEALIKLRTSIKENSTQNFYLPVIYVNRGTIVNTGEEPTNVIGTLVDTPEELSNLTLEVSTGKILKGVANVNYPKGRVLIRQNGTIIPAVTRKLTSVEAHTVLQLTKKLVEQIVKKDEKNLNTLGSGFSYSISAYINNYVHTSPDSNKPFDITSDSVIVGDNIISHEDFLKGQFDEELVNLLQDKALQVFNSRWLNDTKKEYKQVVWDATKQTFVQKSYPNYKAYLLNSENPPLKVVAKKDVKVSENQTLNNPSLRRFQNGYIMYAPTLNKTKDSTNITSQPSKTDVGANSAVANLAKALAAQGKVIEKDNEKAPNNSNPNDNSSVNTPENAAKVNATLANLISNLPVIDDTKDNKNTSKKAPNKPINPDELGLNKLASDSGARIDVNKAIENLAKILNIPVEIVNNKLIDDVAEGRLTKNGRILLSTLAEEGTEYHEAFHYVTQFLLTDAERTELYNEKRKQVGDKFSNLQVEEMLAEDFRKFAVNDDKKQLTKKQQSFFERIIDFFNNLFNLKSTNSRLINNLFTSIKAGEFKNSTPLIKEMNYDKLNSSTTDKARAFHAYFAEVIHNNPELYFLMEEDKDFNFNWVYAQAANLLVEPFNVPDEGAERQAVIELLKDYINAHKKYVKNIGLQLVVDEEDLLNEEDENKVDNESSDLGKRDSEDWDESYKKSSVSNVYKPIRLLVSGLTQEVIDGVKKSVVYEETLYKISNTLAGAIGYNDMLARLRTSNDLALNELAEKLGELNSDTSIERVKLILGFYEQFSKTKNTFFKGILNTDEYGNNSIGIANSNTTTVENKVKTDWLNNLKNIKANKYIKRVDGKIILNGKLDFTTAKQAIDILEGLGLNTEGLTPEYLISQSSQEDFTTIKSFIEFLNQTLDAKKNKGVLGDITDVLTKKSAFKGKVDSVLNILAKRKGEIVENKGSTAKGAIVHALSNKSYFTKIIDAINSGILPDYLFDDAYSNDSLIASLVLNSDSSTRINIKTAINTGLASSVSDGEDTSKLSYSDMIALDLNMVLSGIYPLLPTGDKKTARNYIIEKSEGSFKSNHLFINLERGNKTFDAVVDEITDQLFAYYESEKKLKKELSSRLKETILPNGERRLKNETLFDSIVDSSLNKRKAIKEFVLETIQENKKLFEDSGLLSSNSSVISKNILRNTIGKDSIKTEEDMNLIMAAFTGNFMISAVEQTKVFFGHPFFYKDFIDLFKRYAGAVAETNALMDDKAILDWMDSQEEYKRIDGKKRDGYFSTLIVEDIKAINKELSSLGYEGINESDAYGIIFDDFFRDVHFLSNRWSEEWNEQFLKEVEGVEGDLEIPSASKLVAFGSQEENLLRPFYLKFATFRVGKLLMETIKSQQEVYPKLNDLLNKVKDLAEQGTYIDMVVFRSGNKVGTRVDESGKTQLFYNEQGEIADINTDFISTLPLSNIGIQVENKPKESNKVTTGTQVRAIELSNLYENGEAITEQVIVNGKPMSVKDAVEESFKVQNELTTELKHDIFTSLSMEINENGYVFTDGGKKLLDALTEEQNKRSGANNDIDGIVAELSALKDQDSIVLEKLVNKVKLQYILSSFIKNKAINQERNGKSMVQFPSTGFELSNKTKEVNSKGKSEFTSDTLKFYTDSLNRRVLQVYMPYYFKGKLEQGTKISQYKDSNLKTMYGFRIPTEQLNSIDVIEVAGFLPKSYGNSVVVATGITTKVGSDFDFDKLNIYMPNFKTIKHLSKEAVKSFFESKWFKGLSDVYQKEIKKLNIEQISSLVEDLNQYSMGSEKGFMGDLWDSTFYKSQSKQNQQFLNAFKNALMRYNEQNHIKGVKMETTEVVSQEYIDYSEENLANPKYKKQALENRLLELSIGLTSAEFRKDEHLTPNSIEDVHNPDNPTNTVVDNIRKAKEKVDKNLLADDNNKFSWKDLFRFKIISDLRNKFWYGKDLVGIFAVHNKHHVIAQIAGLKIKTAYKINFKGINAEESNNGEYVYSLAKIKNSKNQYISGATGQAVSLSVDIAKNPDILPVINLNAVTADVAMYLVRLGVPKDTVYYFLSQPILKDYASLIAENNGWLSSNDLSNKDILDILETKYGKASENSIEFTDKELLSYKKENQANILADFLSYKESASTLSEFQRGVSFDTLDFKTQEEMDFAVYNFGKVMGENTLINKEKYINTFIKGFVDVVEESRSYWNNLFFAQQLPQAVQNKLNPVKHAIYERKVKKAEKLKAVNILTNDLLTYIITNSPAFEGKSINDVFSKLLEGDESVANRLEKFKEANPIYSALNNLVGDFNPKNNGVNNVKIFNKKLSSYEVDEIVDTLRDVFNTNTKDFNGKQFAEDLIKLIFLQSGFNPSNLNYINIIPSVTKDSEMSFSLMLNNILAKFSINDLNTTEFIQLFYQNNVENNAIVPKYKAKYKKIKDGKLILKPEHSLALEPYIKFWDANKNVNISDSVKGGWRLAKNTASYNSKGELENVGVFELIPVKNDGSNFKDYRKAKKIAQASSPVSTQKIAKQDDLDKVAKYTENFYKKLSQQNKDLIAQKKNIKNIVDAVKFVQTKFDAVLKENSSLDKNTILSLITYDLKNC